MGATRIELLAFANLTAPGAPFEVILDCWRATFRFAGIDLGTWNLNGVDVCAAFADNGGGTPQTPNTFTLGGDVLNGRPVNFNTTLFFVPGTGGSSGRAFGGFIIKEYYDSNLPDLSER